MFIEHIGQLIFAGLGGPTSMLVSRARGSRFQLYGKVDRDSDFHGSKPCIGDHATSDQRGRSPTRPLEVQ
jgi:hypothetical protein